MQMCIMVGVVHVSLVQLAKTVMLLVTYFLHVIPVGNDAVFDGVAESEDTSLYLSLVAYVLKINTVVM